MRFYAEVKHLELPLNMKSATQKSTDLTLL